MHVLQNLQRAKGCISQQFTKTNYKLQLLASEYFSVVFAIWIIFYYCYLGPKKPVEFPLIRTIFSQLRNAYSKLVIETIEQNVKSLPSY